MSKENSSPNLSDQLPKRTVIFGLHLWVVVGICVGAAFVLLLFLISLWFASRRSSSRSKHSSIPDVSKEIQEIRIDSSEPKPLAQVLSMAPPAESNPSSAAVERQALLLPREDESPIGANKIHIEIGKDHRISYPECRSGSLHGSGEHRSVEQVAIVVPEVSHLGWGHWGQAEREFKVEVEAIGRVRHKNLVRLLGYCAEGAHRMLVYEYVDNGNLEQWLHGDVGPCSPLTWELRVNIILGTAKGLMYLHEGLEPKVVHRDVKSSNILLDKQWNPKVSDFGLAKLLGSERTYVTTRVMGTFGYVAPEYASTGMLNEKSDVYSFGILIMEIISGRKPVDYSRPPGEVNLVDWLKTMVSNRNSEGVLDPKMLEKPSSRTLKRVLLVALRCVDPDAQKRPKMGHVIHMLEVDDFPYRDDHRAGQRVCLNQQEKSTEKTAPESVL
ncbi:hypothetical protein HPP92_011966 [Vanilla planifolia]|uniref:non-specific serine/threonine protein kinase n=1 Tax=Vanilla planifolia TaxID=51239 RepID=A0A835R034_VANPL|nr:hypothetical protein HPP92_011966 [Vanilla planifolia]